MNVAIMSSRSVYGTRYTQFPTLLFADQVELNLTFAVDPENKRGFGKGETLATVPYRAICDQSSRGSHKQSQGSSCGNMSHVLFTVNSNGKAHTFPPFFLFFN